MLFPHDYAAFLDQTLPGPSDPLEAERTRWKTDHCQIGHSLAAAWNFPSVLKDVIAHHHDAITTPVAARSMAGAGSLRGRQHERISHGKSGSALGARAHRKPSAADRFRKQSARMKICWKR